jgi:hypothetical protein
MEIYYLESNFNKRKISIKKYKDSIYNVKYENKTFLIKPPMLFTNSSAFLQNIYKIRININLSNPEHKHFKSLINKLCNALELCIEDEEALDISETINPIGSSKILSNTDVLFLNINKNTILLDYESEQELNKEMLINKAFDIYPIINAPGINISNTNNNAYINFSLRKAYVKFINNKHEDNIFIDKKELDDIFSNT